jgi:rare lipoprotein A
MKPYAAAWPSKSSPSKSGPSGSAPPARQAWRDNAPRGETVGAYKIGAPYEVRGVWYVPAEEPDYNETGIASWYGDEFRGKRTASGEMFDAGQITAAHTTLPLGSLVEVTNLSTGRTVEVRLNDRGPFTPGRIIDLSRAAAEQLGIRGQGTASVRVRYLRRFDGLQIAANEPVRRGPLAMPGAMPAVTGSAILSTPVQPRPAAAPRAEPVVTRVSNEGGWSVQAGAFSEPGRADRVASTLRKAGRTSIKPLERDGRTLYRVLVGPWRDQDDAAAARRQVAGLGFDDAKVVEHF